MGEVYRARDTRLGREVAIKVLPASVGHDPERVARLRREAEVLASLNHSHIAAIYDLLEVGTAPFLVLELVDGETLAERIARGPLPLHETLAVARQIAEALEAAHDRGIIHRDLKPANVKITADGHVKVLDFGLAKLHSGTDDGSSGTDVSTMMATSPGVIVGTVAYMSPEQVNGAEATRASDMWAFGCVLYEMLAGRRAFAGPTMSEILANVLKSEPEWRQLPIETPPRIQRLLRRALQKDPKLRLRDMRDVRLEIDDLSGEETPAQDRPGSGRPARRERLAWASALALVVVIAGLLGVRALRPAPAPAELRLDINTPPTRNPSIALSPDGSKIVFVATSDGQPRLWLRALGSSSAQPLGGTERAAAPFWSPDGRSLGFYADARLKRLDIEGGSPTVLAVAAVPLGGTWNSDGTIVFGQSPGGPLVRISAAGGDPTPTTRVASAEQRGHAFPVFLPDGRHFVFFSIGSTEARGVYLGQLDSLDSTRLFQADGPATYASGHLLFVREGKLLAQGLDLDTMRVRGNPFAIAEGVTSRIALSASAAGPIAYRAAPADSGQRQFVWLHRSGAVMRKEVYADTAALGPALSRDGRRIAVYRETDGNMDIWSYETSRGAWDRLTFNLGDDIYPLWSRDGGSIVFGAVRAPSVQVNLYRKVLNAPSEELLLAPPHGGFPNDWSADGRFVLFAPGDPKLGIDVWAMPLDGDRKPFAVVRTEFNESQAQFSPDGRWIAYQSDKTGRPEIYIHPFPGTGDEVRASIEGGTQPRWNPSSPELFYIGADDRLMAVPIRVASDGGKIEPGAPLALFRTDVGSTASLAYRQQYVVSPDGRSFIMNSAVTEGSASPITVILNWRPPAR